MRITTNMMYEMGVSRIADQQAILNKTQQQVSTGRRILTPADDPSGAASALQVSQADGLLAQHVENRNLARNGLGIEDGVLQGISDLMQQVKTSIVAAGNGTLGNAERGFIASELRGQLDQLIGLANSTDGNGNYLFSGFQSHTVPFARSGATVSYAGDSGLRALQVSGERQMAVGDSGQDLFLSVPEGNGRFVAAAAPGNTGTGKISSGIVVDPAVITGDDYQITFSVVGTTTTYSVTNVTTGTLMSSGNPYTDGSAIVVDGSSVPTIVAATPASPATFQPITATNSTFGPGAAWAMATDAVNCASLIQPCSPTTKRCMSGAVVMAPPMASSDSMPKCRNSASSTPPSRPWAPNTT